uniref:Ubiquitin-like domain-containing protein n=1 Tax=Eptatretus burgeri TaxID=7764 RepID=A0A8C4R9I9_EPTBU
MNSQTFINSPSLSPSRVRTDRAFVRTAPHPTIQRRRTFGGNRPDKSSKSGFVCFTDIPGIFITRPLICTWSDRGLILQWIKANESPVSSGGRFTSRTCGLLRNMPWRGPSHCSREDSPVPFQFSFLKNMNIFVETLTGASFELRVSLVETIFNVKVKVEILEGIPVSQQHLIWCNTELQDDYCLQDYNIADGATVRLVLAMRGGPVNTRRVALEDVQIPYFPESPPLETNPQLALLVLQQGDHIDLLRVVDRGDGTLSPLSETLSESSLYERCTGSPTGVSEMGKAKAPRTTKGQRLKEDAVMKKKMLSLRSQLQFGSTSKRTKKDDAKLCPRSPMVHFGISPLSPSHDSRCLLPSLDVHCTISRPEGQVIRMPARTTTLPECFQGTLLPDYNSAGNDVEHSPTSSLLGVCCNASSLDGFGQVDAADSLAEQLSRVSVCGTTKKSCCARTSSLNEEVNFDGLEASLAAMALTPAAIPAKTQKMPHLTRYNEPEKAPLNADLVACPVFHSSSIPPSKEPKGRCSLSDRKRPSICGESRYKMAAIINCPSRCKNSKIPRRVRQSSNEINKVTWSPLPSSTDHGGTKSGVDCRGRMYKESSLSHFRPPHITGHNNPSTFCSAIRRKFWRNTRDDHSWPPATLQVRSRKSLP